MRWWSPSSIIVGSILLHHEMLVIKTKTGNTFNLFIYNIHHRSNRKEKNSSSMIIETKCRRLKTTLVKVFQSTKQSYIIMLIGIKFLNFCQPKYDNRIELGQPALSSRESGDGTSIIGGKQWFVLFSTLGTVNGGRNLRISGNSFV